jgi:ubiquinone/menaquinone biosynthesis C-methylase UbiE
MNIKESLRRIWIESKQITKFSTHDRKVFFDIARKYFDGCDKILDLGSGSGKFIEFLGRDDIYALDGNEESVKILKTLTKNATYSVLPNIPFPDDYFDGIHASHILEHLCPEDFYKTLKEMDRTLKKGGVLIVSSPMLWYGFYDDLSHIKPYHPQILKSYLCDGQLSQSPTRSHITGYKVRDLVYRYQFQELNPIIVKNLNLFNFLSNVSVRLLRKVGIGRACKTGYTIVFEKIEQ